MKEGQIKANLRSNFLQKNCLKYLVSKLESHKILQFLRIFSKAVLKIYLFLQHSKKTKIWPNGQTNLFLRNSFKKAKFGDPDRMMRIAAYSVSQKRERYRE